MGSGSSIDLAVIKPNDNIDYLRPYEKLIPKGERKGSYKYPKGTTSVLSTNTYQIEDVQVRSIPMETWVIYFYLLPSPGDSIILFFWYITYNIPKIQVKNFSCDFRLGIFLPQINACVQ